MLHAMTSLNRAVFHRRISRHRGSRRRSGSQAFRSPYAAVGGMTIAHGFQYLLLVGLVAAGNRRGTSRWLRLAVFANLALVGGALLSGASHLHGFPLTLGW